MTDPQSAVVGWSSVIMSLRNVAEFTATLSPHIDRDRNCRLAFTGASLPIPSLPTSSVAMVTPSLASTFPISASGVACGPVAS